MLTDWLQRQGDSDFHFIIYTEHNAGGGYAQPDVRPYEVGMAQDVNHITVVADCDVKAQRYLDTTDGQQTGYLSVDLFPVVRPEKQLVHWLAS